MNRKKEIEFERIIAENKDRIFRVCYAYLYDRTEVEDLYQEILINIWQNMGTFRNEAKISTWIYRISINTALLFNRKTKRRNKLFSTLIKDEQMESIATDTLLEKIELEHSLNRLAHCISTMREKDKALLSLVLEGLSYQEIADILGITVNNVGVKINRSKERLGKKMKQLAHGL